MTKLPKRHQKTIVPQQRHALGAPDGRGGRFKPKPGRPKPVIGPSGIGAAQDVPSTSSAIR